VDHGDQYRRGISGRAKLGILHLVRLNAPFDAAVDQTDASGAVQKSGQE
jgi:hypothetical protein